ncbi:MAG TPA: serine/threonine-protein kinase [Polyangiaceae bacterium]|nr:serine/threonine-protein kinase [Polyangiaceae bacterium]
MAHLDDISLLLVPALTACVALCLVMLGWARPRFAGVAAASTKPQQLGPYTLENKIGAGAMGEVYRAWHPALGGWRAVKLLPRDASARDRQRFEKEARLGAELSHPNTVSIFDRGEGRDGTCYFAMELLDGVNLQQLVERDGPQSPERVVQILMQLCAALEEAHGKGLVHRDIKPENVLLTGEGRDVAKLIDFGLVEQVGAVADSSSLDVLVGTPLYMSPEAIVAPETVDAQSDLYGLGAVAYFLLRGAPVFHGRSVVEVCSHHLHSAPEPLSQALGAALSPELESLVMSCLAKDRAARPASAAELGRRLARCIETQPAPLCLAVVRAQRMLDRLEAVVSGAAAPSERCPIAA